jgi:hypothetical protein
MAKRATLERQIAELRTEHEASDEELHRVDKQVGTKMRLLTYERTALGRLRQADVSSIRGTRGKTNPRI